MTAPEIIVYVFAFLSIYVEVFLLITFLESRKKIVRRSGSLTLATYPSVTIIVPCWNEEKTLYKTVRSLQELNYPKDKVNIFLVDDGSTDSTWNVMQRFEKYTNIKIFHKENGGKHTAMNLGIEAATTDFVGCLDADSFVDKEALGRIMSYFAADKTTMAVVPSVVVHKPKTFIQKIQVVDYMWGVYRKKMLDFLGGIHVTPGPFSIYRREIFATIGLFRKAHNTEDMEIAYRMQKHHLKIVHCNDAFIYTVTPDTVKKLYIQRLRWIYGFIKNTIDYRKIIFSRKHGSFSWFTLPAGVISIIAAVVMFGLLLANTGKFLWAKIEQVRAAGFSHVLNPQHIDWFFINTGAINLVMVVLYVLVITTLFISVRLTEGKTRFPFITIPFMLVFSVIAPFWILKAVWNVATSQRAVWR